MVDRHDLAVLRINQRSAAYAGAAVESSAVGEGGKVAEVDGRAADNRRCCGKVSHYAAIFAQVIKDARACPNCCLSISERIPRYAETWRNQNPVAVAQSMWICGVVVDDRAGERPRSDKSSDGGIGLDVGRVIWILTALSASTLVIVTERLLCGVQRSEGDGLIKRRNLRRIIPAGHKRNAVSRL